MADSDLAQLEEGMPVLYRFVEGEFKAHIAELKPKYDPLMRKKSVKLSFGPDEKIHPIYVNGYGAPGRVRLENPTLFERLFMKKEK